MKRGDLLSSVLSRGFVLVPLLLLAVPRAVEAQQQYCALMCDWSISCNAPCVDGNNTTCGAYGICDRQPCSEACTPSSGCSTACTINGFEASNCGAWGVCGGYPPGSGSTTPACSSCSMYSKCDQQCNTNTTPSQPSTCGQAGPCGQCAPDKTYTTNWWNDGSGNCYTQPFQNPDGADCTYVGFQPGNPSYCQYSCTLTCPNLR